MGSIDRSTQKHQREMEDITLPISYIDYLKKYRLIGISGKIGSGKTTLSQYLQTKYPDLKKRSFAERVREVLSIVANIPVEKTRTSEDKNVYLPEWEKTVGEMLQSIGTDAFRKEVHIDTWVISLFSEYTETDWIIDDVRYVNEADGIRKHGGILIRLEGDPGNIRDNSSRDLNHESETALDDYKHFDVVINTDNFINDEDGIFNRINDAILENKVLFKITQDGLDFIDLHKNPFAENYTIFNGIELAAYTILMDFIGFYENGIEIIKMKKACESANQCIFFQQDCKRRSRVWKGDTYDIIIKDTTYLVKEMLQAKHISIVNHI